MLRILTYCSLLLSSSPVSHFLFPFLFTIPHMIIYSKNGYCLALLCFLQVYVCFRWLIQLIMGWKLGTLKSWVLTCLGIIQFLNFNETSSIGLCCFILITLLTWLTIFLCQVSANNIWRSGRQWMYQDEWRQRGAINAWFNSISVLP